METFAHHRSSSVPSPIRTLKTATPIDPPEPPPYFPEQEKDEHAPASGLLQPRVAVALNVPSSWYPWLFTLRLTSVLPALWFGWPSAFRFLLRVTELCLAWHDGRSDAGMYNSLPLTEIGLGIIWCFASGYLSFFFTDCLMSRWLLNYGSHGIFLRLVTVNLLNACVTRAALYLAGGFHDHRLLLPGWIGIATTLTVLYHLTNKRINIRKETSTSVNVFSIASFISMIALLAHTQNLQQDYPITPIVSHAKFIRHHAIRILAPQLQESLDHGEL